MLFFSRHCAVPSEVLVLDYKIMHCFIYFFVVIIGTIPDLNLSGLLMQGQCMLQLFSRLSASLSFFILCKRRCVIYLCLLVKDTCLRWRGSYIISSFFGRFLVRVSLSLRRFAIHAIDSPTFRQSFGSRRVRMVTLVRHP